MTGIKHIFLLVLLLLKTAFVFAQMDNEPRNLPKYDHQKAHFGFTLGINTSSFLIDRVGDLKIRDSIYSIEGSSVSGLNLGIISNLKLGEHFDLRFIPTLSFGQRNLKYHFIYNDSSEVFTDKQIESTYLEFPFYLKFKSKRVNNYRIYVFGGYKFAIDMVSQAKVQNRDKDVVKLRRNDNGYEIGLGVDFYLTYFKFAPEIKMYHGLRNLLIKEDTPFSSPLEALYSKTFAISFTFE